MNDDADIWAAFASSPPPIEPVANRDNSLAGFQRRLLGECGYKLEQATAALTHAEAVMAATAAALDEIRTRYDQATDRLIAGDALLREAFQLLYSAQYSQLVPYGIGDLLERIGNYWDA
jgi:predicted aminopeptidase